MGNILFGIAFIIGGASGSCVLRGTNSSGALIVIGVGLCIWGIIQVVRNKGDKEVDTLEKELETKDREEVGPGK
jgi:hypothetical protein